MHDKDALPQMQIDRHIYMYNMRATVPSATASAAVELQVGPLRIFSEEKYCYALRP